MRNQTLAGICVALAVAVGLGLRLMGITLPLGLSPFAVSLVLVPVLLVVLTPLNKRLLASKGRDLEMEERHDNEEADVISLRAREKREEDSIRYYDKRR
jgi:hypothetical protein